MTEASKPDTPTRVGLSEGLGHLPHPEHGWTWTEREVRWIREYVAEQVAAERERHALKPLSDEQLDDLAMDEDGLPKSHLEFARAIERAHGIRA
jgi:uncharacterized protein YjiS (DUF1127 family)